MVVSDYPIIAKNDAELQAAIEQIQREFGPETKIHIVPRFGAKKSAEAHEVSPGNP